MELCECENIARQNESLPSSIQRYWSERAVAFSKVRRQELASEKAVLWWNEIYSRLPHGRKQIKVLDVGTGAGFFAILFAKHGFQVTAIDVSQAMLDKAAHLAEHENCFINFMQMDGNELNFPNASFDCIVGRNITWTLIDPAKAYREWWRVLKPGGVLINFDADYGSVDFISLGRQAGQHAHDDIPQELLSEGERIRKNLPLTIKERPQWDVELIENIGFSRCTCDRTVSRRIFKIQDATYNPVPMFCLAAIK